MPQTATNLIDECLAAVLRGEQVADLPDLTDPALIVDRVLFHGVQCLLMSHPGFLSRLPEDVSQRLRQEALAFTSWEMRGRPVLQALLRDLAEKGIPSALLKGTALAYSCYASPSERPKGDIDLLVSPENLEEAQAILAKQGFLHTRENELIRTTQGEWTLHQPNGQPQILELHHNLLPSLTLSDVFHTDHLLETAQPLPKLCPEASMLSDAMALLHACIHRAAHFRIAYYVDGNTHFDGDRLIWLYDMHLLAGGMDERSWHDFLKAAAMSGSAPLCHDALRMVQARFGTLVPAFVDMKLAQAPRSGRVFDFYVHTSLLKRIFSDMAYRSTDQSKLAYLRMVFFPSGTALRQMYPECADHSVPYLQLRRYKDRLTLLWKEWRQKGRQR